MPPPLPIDLPEHDRYLLRDLAIDAVEYAMRAV